MSAYEMAELKFANEITLSKDYAHAAMLAGQELPEAEQAERLEEIVRAAFTHAASACTSDDDREEILEHIGTIYMMAKDTLSAETIERIRTVLPDLYASDGPSDEFIQIDTGDFEVIENALTVNTADAVLPED